MKKTHLSVAILGIILSSQALAVDFHGYVRSGYGISNNGGGLEADDAFNTKKLGRLGNEFDTYADIGLGQELYKEDGKSMYFDSVITMTSDGKEKTEKTENDSAVFAIKHLNLQAKGFIPAAPEATLWAGKRGYQAHDLHINDTKYWDINGYGFGLEGLSMGPGSLSTAVIRGDENDVNISFIDVRYAGFRPWKDAWTEVGIDYAMPNLTDDQVDTDTTDFDNGVMITAELSQGFSKGYNKTVLQYADKGLAQNMISQGGGWYDAWGTGTDNVDKVNKAKGYRLINTGDIKVTDNFMFEHVFTYGHASDHETTWANLGTTWKEVDSETLVSLVVRPAYNWSKNHKTLFELGYFKQTQDLVGGGDYKISGQKLTVAQVISAGDYILARPEMRFYVSYVKDNERDSFNNGRDDSDIRFGAKVEAWW